MKNPSPAPAYVMLYECLCEVAREHGYALAIHGTMQRDLDLVAIPWVDEAGDPEILIEALRKRGQHWMFEEPEGERPPVYKPTLKPQGRVAYSLTIMGGRFVDISVMPRVTK